MKLEPIVVTSNVGVVCDNDALMADAHDCAKRLNTCVNADVNTDYILHFSEAGTGLYLTGKKRALVVTVDFCAGKVAHRRQYGGGKGQMIAKAVGISSKYKPSVFDATAGLGKDAFVLATLGCQVTLMERSPIAFALLKDGLRRGRLYAEAHEPELSDVFERMNLVAGDSIQYLASHEGCVADVIYLDPMFPSKQKKAAVKKEMAAFHCVVGQDLDGESLFVSAGGKATYRVAVKRSRHAPIISAEKPTYSLEGKSSRYDIYAYKGLT